MTKLLDADIDSAPLEDKRIAVIGYGNQGRAQAQNLRDSGCDVVVGLRDGSPSFEVAAGDGVQADLLPVVVENADVVMLLVPDEEMEEAYSAILPAIKEGAALAFSHGLAIHFQLIETRDDLDVILVAPKGPGTALRSLYQHGEGMVGLFAVARDKSGKARDIALAYGKAIGCARAGLIESSFAEECEADLFNEGAVVWGAVPEVLVAGFDTLVEAGVSPEVAYLECVGELKLIAELIEARGIAGMREAISNTAELGAVLGGKKVIDGNVKARMREILVSVRDGSFAAALKHEKAENYPVLIEARKRARALAVEQARKELES